LHGRVEAVDHFLVGDAKDSKAQCAVNQVSFGIDVPLTLMNWAVDFHHETCPWAVEIHDKAANHLLATEWALL